MVKKGKALSSNSERSLFAGIFCMVELHSNGQDRIRGADIGSTILQKPQVMFAFNVYCIYMLHYSITGLQQSCGSEPDGE